MKYEMKNIAILFFSLINIFIPMTFVQYYFVIKFACDVFINKTIKQSQGIINFLVICERIPQLIYFIFICGILKICDTRLRM